MNDSVKSLVEVSTRTINGKEVLAVTSLQVAEHFGKEHFNVLNDIRRTIDKCSESFNALNFQAVEYTDAKGEKRPMYLLSKDGFMMVAMAYITPEAMRIKEAYIARFNEMEEQLRTTSPLLPNFRDPIAAAEAWIVAKDVCGCLGLENISEALRGLDEDEKITLSNPDGNPRAGIGVEIMVAKPGDTCHYVFVPLTRDIQRLSL